MKVCVTIDMDNHAEYRRLVDPDGDAEGPSFLLEAAPRFLEALERNGLRATFFAIGRDARDSRHHELLREIVARGHEIGNHSDTHPYDLRSLTREQKHAEIARAEEAIADATGVRPVGFRAPSSGIDVETHELLEARGYLYDSSVAPTWLMWLFMVYGALFVRHADYSLGDPRIALAPRRPYRPRPDALHRAARGGPARELVEMPLSVVPGLGIPFYGTLLRIFGARGFDWCARVHGRRRPLLHVIYHLMDLVDWEDTSLGSAMQRRPGLGVSFARRRRFVEASLSRVARMGEGVPMREAARTWLAADC